MNGVVLAGSTGAGESLLAMNGEGDALAGRLGGRLMVSRSERKLIRAAQGGSEAAMEELFRLHWPRAQRAAFLVVHDRAAAEDIAQEAFLSALRALERFDRRRPFGPWLHRIVVNRAIDYARSRKLRREVEPEAEVADDRPAPLAGAGLSEELMRALATLSVEHRAVVVLRYLLDFTPGEIAEALEMPRGTVNSRLRRGLDRLSLVLEEER
jgi:RNA polymerase sigma-70 factor (ECF subfamily)